MITKNYSKTGKSCRVTFRHTPTTEVEKVVLLGEFNQWGEKSIDELKKRKDGSYSITLSLEAGAKYRFRYLLDESQWLNDEQADEYVWNSFGSQDAVLSLENAQA